MWLCHQVTFESLLANSSLGQAHALFGIMCGSSSHENPKPPIVAVLFLSCVWFFVTPWTAAHQAHLSSTYLSLMPSNHLILCCLLLWSSTFLSIRVFPSESPLRITWPKDWNLKFSINPSNEDSGLISFRMVGSPCSARVNKIDFKFSVCHYYC